MNKFAGLYGGSNAWIPKSVPIVLQSALISFLFIDYFLVSHIVLMLKLIFCVSSGILCWAIISNDFSSALKITKISFWFYFLSLIVVSIPDEDVYFLTRREFMSDREIYINLLIVLPVLLCARYCLDLICLSGKRH